MSLTDIFLGRHFARDQGVSWTVSHFQFGSPDDLIPPDETSSAQREALLAAVRAQGAQLMSLQKAGAEGFTKRVPV